MWGEITRICTFPNLNGLRFGLDKQFDPKLYWYNYLSMLGLKLSKSISTWFGIDWFYPRSPCLRQAQFDGMNIFCDIQYIPRNMHSVFALLCFVVVIHWLIFPYPSGLLHWYCSNLTIAPVPAKQPWWIWINTSFEFIMNDCITTTKQSTTKPCAYFLGYTVLSFRYRTYRNEFHGTVFCHWNWEIGNRTTFHGILWNFGFLNFNVMSCFIEF